MNRDERTHHARLAADAIERASADKKLPAALIGFDGFVDSIMEAVDSRTDLSDRGYTRLPTIPALAARIGGAAGKSTNIELVEREKRFGGNGPLLASALGSLGFGVTYVGCVGRDDEPTRLSPVYAPLAAMCTRIVPICAPGRTDCIEFTDGKIMFNVTHAVQGATWERIVEVMGREAFIEAVSKSSLIGVMNWVMLRGVEGVWAALANDVLPECARRGSHPHIFIDLCDPAKRIDADVRRAMDCLRELAAVAPLTLGLNLAESERIARVMNLPQEVGADADPGPNHGITLARRASAIRERLGASSVAIHPRHGAAGATADATAWVDGPFTRTPRLSTGAGDHFNGGYAAAIMLGLPLEQRLLMGCATSGSYVRDAGSPDVSRLVAMLRDMPLPERVES